MTIKDIANLAGVSPATVSKIINGKDKYINEQTKERVLSIVKEYNYSPYAGIKFKNTKSFIIGVLLNHSTQNLLQGILNCARSRGYSVLFYSSSGSLEEEKKSLSVLSLQNIDGLIWEPIEHQESTEKNLFAGKGIPVYCINGDSPDGSYSINYSEIGYYLTEQLIKFHHSAIGCICKKGSIRSERVISGYKKCLYDHDIAFESDMLIPISEPEANMSDLCQKFTGFVCTHYANALIMYKIINGLNYSIPEDISLVSLRDDVREALFYPAISSTPIPYLEFGSFIAGQLIECIEGLKGSDNPVFSVPLNLSSDSSLSVPSSLQEKSIISVGAINIDSTFIVEAFPDSGKTVLASSSIRTLGGKGANQAVGVARLGHRSVILGRVGNDSDSSIVFNSLKEECVVTNSVSRDMKNATGQAMILLQKDGESTITVLPGANASLSAESIRQYEHQFEEAAYCLISTEIPVKTVAGVLRICRKHKVKTILKPCAVACFPEDLYSFIDILVPNKQEADTLCPDSSMSIEEKAAYFTSMGAKEVIITLGEKGCYSYSDGKGTYHPAVTIFSSVDNSGAADAFISALASALAEGYSISSAIQISNYAAAFSTSRAGVTPSLIDRASLESYIRRQGINRSSSSFPQ